MVADTWVSLVKASSRSRAARAPVTFVTEEIRGKKGLSPGSLGKAACRRPAGSPFDEKPARTPCAGRRDQPRPLRMPAGSLAQDDPHRGRPPEAGLVRVPSR